MQFAEKLPHNKNSQTLVPQLNLLHLPELVPRKSKYTTKTPKSIFKTVDNRDMETQISDLIGVKKPYKVLTRSE